MSEESMVQVVDEALASAGIEDSVTAVGEFTRAATPAPASPAA